MASNGVGGKETYRKNLQGWDPKMGEIWSIGRGRETQFQMKKLT